MLRSRIKIYFEFDWVHTQIATFDKRTSSNRDSNAQFSIHITFLRLLIYYAFKKNLTFATMQFLGSISRKGCPRNRPAPRRVRSQVNFSYMAQSSNLKIPCDLYKILFVVYQKFAPKFKVIFFLMSCVYILEK